MKKSRLLGVVCAFLVTFVYHCVSHAAILTFTDRDSWRAAAGGGTGDLTEDFNTFSGTTSYGNTTGVTAGFLNFAIVSGDRGEDPSWSIRDTTPLGGSQTVNGSPYVSLVAYRSADINDTLITHSGIGAFGFDYSGPSDNPLNDADPLTLVTSLSDSITGPIITGSSSGFFGFIYTQGEVFTSIQIRDLTDSRSFFAADNFEAFSTVAAIPVPASLWLFGSGLLGLIGMARRKKAA